MGLRMLLLLHALIPCLAAYILSSSPVLLHIYCTCFSTFWHCHPYILQHFNGNESYYMHNSENEHVSQSQIATHHLWSVQTTSASLLHYIAITKCIYVYIYIQRLLSSLFHSVMEVSKETFLCEG